MDVTAMIQSGNLIFAARRMAKEWLKRLKFEQFE
jgi:uncharacterized protein (DUF1697 family)